MRAGTRADGRDGTDDHARARDLNYSIETPKKEKKKKEKEGGEKKRTKKRERKKKNTGNENRVTDDIHRIFG